MGGDQTPFRKEEASCPVIRTNFEGDGSDGTKRSVMRTTKVFQVDENREVLTRG